MFRNIIMSAIVLLLAGPARSDDRVPINDLKGNVRARLVAARISETRGQYLIMKFETVEKEPQSLVFDFPAHSLTAHEQTLQAIVRSCVDFTGKARHEWKPSRAEAVFSIPDLATLRELDQQSRLARCALITLGPAKAE